jgi:hypothetical protein
LVKTNQKANQADELRKKSPHPKKFGQVARGRRLTVDVGQTFGRPRANGRIPELMQRADGPDAVVEPFDERLRAAARALAALLAADLRRRPPKEAQ